MKKFHESGLFLYKYPNGLVTNKMPIEVRNYRIHLRSGRVIESFYNKIFYLHDLNILEVELQNGEKRFFEYREKKKMFIEISKEDMLMEY